MKGNANLKWGLLVTLLFGLVLALVACAPDANPADPDAPVRVTVTQAEDVSSWDPPQDWGPKVNG